MTKRETHKRPSPPKVQVPQPGVPIGLIQQTSQRTYPAWMVPPEVLNGLNEVVENGAERMFSMAEKEQNVTHEFERKRLEQVSVVTKQDHNETILGQWLAFFVCVFLIALSGWAIYLNHEIIGALISCGGMAGIITAFIKRGRDGHSLPSKNK